MASAHGKQMVAVKSYGPLLRFIAGAPFTAHAVTSAALEDTTARGADEPTQRTGGALGTAAANLSPPR